MFALGLSHVLLHCTRRQQQQQKMHDVFANDSKTGEISCRTIRLPTGNAFNAICTRNVSALRFEMRECDYFFFSFRFIFFFRMVFLLLDINYKVVHKIVVDLLEKREREWKRQRIRTWMNKRYYVWEFDVVSLTVSQMRIISINVLGT